MNKLLIDTATKTLIVSLYNNNDLIDSRIELANRDHSSRLMPAIESLLQENSLDVTDLDGIYCSKGPGSYTGVRIGVTVAKTLAWTLKKDLYSISSLKLIAALTQLKESTLILPIIDARRGNVFAALYKYDGKQLVEVIADGLYDFKGLLERVCQETSGEVMVVGTDVLIHNELLSEYDVHVEMNENYQSIINQVMNLSDFEKVNEIHEFVPSYKRLTEAERNLKK